MTGDRQNMGAHEVVSYQQACDKYEATLIDPGPEQHLWSVMCMFGIANPGTRTDQILLDKENLLTVEGPLCYKCGRNWDHARSITPCTGHMESDPPRPYGPKGECICVECGRKDPAATERAMGKYLGLDL